MQVMPTAYPCTRLDRRSSGRKHPLPGPVDITVRHRPSERTGKGGSAQSASKVPMELLSDSPKVLPKGGDGADWQWNAPILTALATPNDDLASIEVDVLYAQGETFRNTEAASIQKRGAQTRNAAQPGHHGSYLGFREYGGQPPTILRAIDTRQMADRLPEHVSVQEENRAQRLILSRGADVTVGGEVTEKRGDLTLTHLCRMTSVVKDDEPPYPVDVCDFRALTVATSSEAVPDSFEQSQLSLGLGRAPKVGQRYLGVPR